MNPTVQRPGPNRSIAEPQLLIRVASIDENKNSHRNITMTYTQITYSNRITLHAGKKRAHPLEVGSLASEFEKSDTELKLKQNLLKYKHTIQIAIFNVGTLNRIGQLRHRR